MAPLSPNTSANSQTSFHAIIIGGGVAGLLASHTLSSARISHTVLERGPVADPALGASIAMYPHGARILQQLGILDAVNAASFSVAQGATDRWPDGMVYDSSDIWRFIRENHGHDLVFSERRAFLKTLYDTLPDRSRIHFSQHITAIHETPDFIEVRLADGKCHRGDILIGCDGVHSFVRSFMWAQANELHPGLIPASDHTAIQARWQCLLGYAPAEGGLKEEVSVVHDHGYSLMVICVPGQVFFYAFVKNRNPYAVAKGPRYTAADADMLAKRFERRVVAETVSGTTVMFGQLWEKKHRGQLVDTEQGMLERWHFGRTVLVGDAVHKMTPNAGLGANTALESLAVLTNTLTTLLKTTNAKTKTDGKPLCPSLQDIESAFATYQSTRIPRVRETLRLADDMTRAHGWDSLLLKLMCLYIVPYLPERALADKIGKLISGAPRLDFLAWEGFEVGGRMKWEDADASAGEQGGLLGLCVRRRRSTKPWTAELFVAVGVLVAGIMLAYVLRARRTFWQSSDAHVDWQTGLELNDSKW